MYQLGIKLFEDVHVVKYGIFSLITAKRKNVK